MIDFDFFDKYLASKDEGFINYTDRITIEAINYFRSKKRMEWECLFKKVYDTKNPNPFTVEVICNECKEIKEVKMAKTVLFKYISDNRYICQECEKARKEKAKNETEIFDKSKYTESYIASYLNPDNSWKEGVNINEKMHYISDFRILDDIVWRYINSMDYHTFLKTPYWKAIAEKVKSRAKYKCELCYSSNNLVTHHKTYKRHGYEHLYWREDLICLCDKCHEKFHFE